MAINIGNGTQYGILRPIAVTVGVILLVKLFLLQVVSEYYSKQARDNVVKERIVYPARGIMIDRDNKVIVYNDPVYNIMLQYNRLGDFNKKEFCSLLNINEAYFDERMEYARLNSPRRPVEFVRNVKPQDVAMFQENLYRFKGFTVEKKNVRRYPSHGAAHVLGYIGEVDQRTIDESEYYTLGEYHGMIGLERSYEEMLRGVKGLRYEVVDVFNNVQGSFKAGADDDPAKSGKDIMTTLDIALQSYGEQLMNNKVGSVVAIEPATGEVLAYISSPGYDPNLLSDRYRGRHYAALASDSLKPLYNRPILAEYPPGSTFKPIMSLIAFAEGARRPESGFVCPGGYRIPGHTVNCHDHLPLASGRDAIRYSCNAYYCDALKKLLHGSDDDVETHYRTWTEYMYGFGYGKPLGIDLQYENDGNVPTADYYNKIYGKNRWKASTVISLAIGQGEILATPLQMANTMAIIANRGYYITPHLVRGYVQNDTLWKLDGNRHDVDVDERYFEFVVDGMEDVVRKGTASWVYTDLFTQCGKTGTAENPHGDDHSLFVAFAPKYDPKIAIAVIVENAGFGTTHAAPIASLMMEYYLSDSNKINDKRIWIEERVKNTNLIDHEGQE